MTNKVNHSAKLSFLFLATAAILAGTNTAQANELEASTKVKLSANPTETLNLSQPTDNLRISANSSSDDSITNLKNLTEKYQCGTNANLSNADREELAQSLNNCIQSLEQQVAQKPDSVNPNDLIQLQRLTQDFRNELSTIDSKLQKIESRVLAQNNNNFSPTTKLVGEVIFGLNFAGGSDKSIVQTGGTAVPTSNNVLLGNRARLNFRTSFTGKDLLITRLQSRNLNSFSNAPTGTAPPQSPSARINGAGFGTNMVRLGFEGNEDNATGIHLLQYQVPFTEQTKLFFTASGNELDSYLPNFNPVLAPAGTGSITRFGRYNPIYRLSGEGAGVAVDHKFNKDFSVSLAYGTPGFGFTNGTPNGVANDPSKGFFNDSNILFSQLAYKANENLDLGFIYARTYHAGGTGISGNNGGVFANNPFGSTTTTPIKTTANHYSVLASTKLNPDLVLSGWVGFSQADRADGTAGNADLFNYALTLAANNVGGKGNTLGFVFGQPPKVTSNSNAARKDKDTSLHFETFYRYKLTDNIFITPGIALITNPEHNSANPAVYVGTVRTTFNF